MFKIPNNNCSTRLYEKPIHNNTITVNVIHLNERLLKMTLFEIFFQLSCSFNSSSPLISQTESKIKYRVVKLLNREVCSQIKVEGSRLNGSEISWTDINK